jgi:nucleoside 2-deoxyribosyltransferase
MKIYLASSWRNVAQPGIVHVLRRCGHEVYDFRNPKPGDDGFRWTEIDPAWEAWDPVKYREALKHPVAERGYNNDITALRECDAVVLLLPSGRSASWEFGYAMGQGKPGYVLMLDKCEPELMYREAKILTSLDELFDAFGEPKERGQ